MAIRHVGASSTRALIANMRRPQDSTVSPDSASAAGEDGSSAALLPAAPSFSNAHGEPAPQPVAPSIEPAISAPSGAGSSQPVADASSATVPPEVDYHSIVRTTVADLPVNTVETRREVYDHAREVVRARLRNADPPLSSFAIAREELRLDRAINVIEAEYLERHPESVAAPVAAATMPSLQEGVSAAPPPPAPRVRAPPPRRRKARAQPVHGIVLRTFGLTAVIGLGLFGYWLATGKPGATAAGRSLARLLPQASSPAAQAPEAEVAALAQPAPPAGEAAAGGPARHVPGTADGGPDDLVSVCQRAVSPTEFLLCSGVGIAPARASAGVDQKLPFWVNAYKGVPGALAGEGAPGTDAAALAPTRLARSANAAAQARFESALARLKANDLERALGDFTEAVRADPQFAEAYMQRGQALFRNGETDRAIADFSTAIEIDARHAAAYKARGMAMLYKGDDDAAIEDLTRAIQFADFDRTRLPPLELFYARRSRAALYDRKRLYDYELADLNAMIEGYWKNTVLVAAMRATYPDRGSVSLMAAIYRMRAGVQGKRGNIDGAVGDLSFAMQLDPQRVLPLTLERARIQEAAGRRAQAAADFARVLQLSPHNEDAQAGAARLKSGT